MKRLLFCVMAAPLILSACTEKQTVGYAGADLTGKVEITRDKETKAASITVREDGEWKVFAGPSVEAIDLKSPVAEGSAPGTFELNVPRDSHSYFQFVQGDNRAILAERHLPMQGGYNFRDLGGFRNTDGKYVRWGMIFRSDDLFHLTESDLAYLASIPMVSVVDFRADNEVAEAPDKLPSTATGYHLAIVPGDMSAAADYSSYSAEQMVEFMKEMNVMFVTNAEFIAQYRRFFAMLQDETKVPLMFHCSAGKDRTGMGAALVLSALGVDQETILSDYESSNRYLGSKYAAYIDGRPNLVPLMTVDRSYLLAGLDRIKADHGSVENFLRDQLGVDIEKFRGMYLY